MGAAQVGREQADGAGFGDVAKRALGDPRGTVVDVGTEPGGRYTLTSP